MNILKKSFNAVTGGGIGRPQNCMLLTEYGEILDLVLDVKKGYIVRELKEQIYEEWGLDIGNQVKDKVFGHMQVISERDTAPVVLWQKPKRNYTKTLLHTIGEAAADQQLVIIEKKANKERTWAFVTLIAVFFLIGIVLLVGTPTIVGALNKGG